ncbi:MAG: LURP-one-related family protein [Anaerolineales bacterium]|nr:LURP-one-related family protein [Anaerolineales bacterium]
MTHRYKLRQRLISLGDDFVIEDEHGQPVYNVDNKLLRIRDTFVITDKEGNEVATIRERMLALRETLDILRGGEAIAVIRKAWFTPLRDKFMIDVKGGDDLVAQGNLLDHEYSIRRGDTVIAQVSKRWFTFRDTYGITINPGEDDGLILAIAVAIDEMVHDDVKSKDSDE